MWEDDESQMPGAELVRRPACEGRLWKTVEDVELATLSWVHWRNHNCRPVAGGNTAVRVCDELSHLFLLVGLKCR